MTIFLAFEVWILGKGVHSMTQESLSLGSLATRNSIVTNLHFVSQAIFLCFRAIFVMLRCNFVMFYAQN